MTKSPFENLASSFWTDEDGAVTVDWVVLTAAVVLLGVLVVAGITTALNSASSDIATAIELAADSITTT